MIDCFSYRKIKLFSSKVALTYYDKYADRYWNIQRNYKTIFATLLKYEHKNSKKLVTHKKTLKWNEPTAHARNIRKAYS